MHEDVWTQIEQRRQEDWKQALIDQHARMLGISHAEAEAEFEEAHRRQVERLAETLERHGITQS